MTLVELLLAVTLMTTVMTSVAVLLRGSYATWQSHENDLARLEAAHATVRHIIRNVRQAESVAAISGPAANNGSLSLNMPDGNLHAWRRDGAGVVRYGSPTADSILAEEITELTLVGYQADGVTPTTVADEIQAVQCTVGVQLPRNAGGSRTIICRGWIRSW